MLKWIKITSKVHTYFFSFFKQYSMRYISICLYAGTVRFVWQPNIVTKYFFFMCWYELLKKIKRSFHITLNGNSSNLLSFILWYCMITNQTTIYYQYWYLYKREQSNGSWWISYKNIQIMKDIRRLTHFSNHWINRVFIIIIGIVINDQYAMYVHNNFWVYLQ